MTPYKITALYKYHIKFLRVLNPDRFEQDKPDNVDDIDFALGGL